jgi:hypothetical protein
MQLPGLLLLASPLVHADWLPLNLTLSTPRSRLTAAAVNDLIIFAGGLDGAGQPSSVVDVFDFGGGQGGARTTLALSVARDFDGGQNMGASLGAKAFFGGGAQPAQSAALDIFDGDRRAFDPTPPPLSSGRSFLATVALPGPGLVLFGGGELAEDEKHPSLSRDSATVDVWDVAAARWRSPLTLSQPRKKLSATAIANGTLAIFAGGFTSDSSHDNCGSPAARPGMGCYRNEVDVLDATSGGGGGRLAWVEHTLRLSEGRMRMAAASAGGCAIFAGGEVNVTHGDASGLVDIFCPSSSPGSGPGPGSPTGSPGSLEQTVAELSARRYELASATLGGRLAFFAGGNPGDGRGDPAGSGRLDVLDQTTRAWTTLQLPTPRDRLAAAAVEARGLVCFGGGEGGGGVHDVVECYEAAL